MTLSNDFRVSKIVLAQKLQMIIAGLGRPIFSFCWFYSRSQIMKRFAILLVAGFAMSLMASESQAQVGVQYGNFGPRSAFSVSVGRGFYHPGWYGGGFHPGGWGGYYAPVYRPVVPVVPVYGYGYGRPVYGGWGGCRW
jgi:hypothetical protein